MRRRNKKASLRRQPRASRRPGRSHTRQRIAPGTLSDLAKRKMLGQTVREFRERSGVSADALSVAVGVSKNVVEAWERGSRSIYIHDVLDICMALKQEPEEMVAFYIKRLDWAERKPPAGPEDDQVGYI